MSAPTRLGMQTNVSALPLGPTIMSAATWAGLFRAGGVAALIAGLVFRRNLGPELTLFAGPPEPRTVSEWFAVLQSNPLVGLAHLSLFDGVDYVLVGLMLLALCVALWRVSPGRVAIAAASGLVGVAVWLASNPALAMLTLSHQYASAATTAEQTQLLMAGQALLALADPGAGAYVSLLCLAVATVMMADSMLHSDRFGRITAWLGLLAGGLDLTYGLTRWLWPELTVVLLASAGLLLMIWHILIGVRLWQLGRIV